MANMFFVNLYCNDGFKKTFHANNEVSGTKVIDVAAKVLKMCGSDEVYECGEIKYLGFSNREMVVKDGDPIEDGRHYLVNLKVRKVLEEKEDFCKILHDLNGGVEKNVLILGETGVGKSTWINAFANYVTFASLDDALLADNPVCLIPTTFDIHHGEKSFPVQYGDVESADENVKNSGQSATLMPKAHVFETVNNGCLRLIDTPGIGDTGGLEQDKKNVDNILRYISTVGEIHAICVLLKPNLSRLTVAFQYCISELFANLHKSAAKNIVFCFTNSRATMFRPGDTWKSLEVYLSELEKKYGISIELSPKTCFCFDNDCFRYLISIKRGLICSEEDKEEMSKSWVKTVAETSRLVKRLLDLEPHSTANTISLNETRRIIETLSPALARITQAVQANIAAVDEHRNHLQKIDETKVGLQQRLKVPVIFVESNALERPRTVCTSTECIGTSSDSAGHVSAVYKTVCHEICYLDGITVFPDPMIQKCYAFSGAEKCRFCKCSWDTHRHIFSEPNEQKKMVDDESVLQLLNMNDDKKAVIAKAIENCETKKRQYEKEQKRINEIAASFGSFLKKNAIVSYNDAVKAYILMSIREAEVVAKNTKNYAKVKGLKKALAAYQAQKKLIEQECGDNSVGGLTDIKVFYDELVNLPLTGSNIKLLFEAENRDREMQFQHTENRFKAERFVPDRPSPPPSPSTTPSPSTPPSPPVVQHDVGTVRNMFNTLTCWLRRGQ